MLTPFHAFLSQRLAYCNPLSGLITLLSPDKQSLLVDKPLPLLDHLCGNRTSLYNYYITITALQLLHYNYHSAEEAMCTIVNV